MPHKPGPWDWDANRLEPAYRGLAHGLVAMVPFWLDGEPHDVVNRVLVPTRSGGTRWMGHDEEWGFHGRYDGDPDEQQWPASFTNLDNIGSVEHTMMVIARPTTSTAESHLFSKGDSSVWISLSCTNTPAWRWSWDDGSTKRTVTGNATGDGEWDVNIGMRRAGNYEAWVNDLKDTGPAVVANDFVVSSNLWSIGGKSWDIGSQEWVGDVAMVAIWDRALTDTEALLLTSDPYGLLREDLKVVSAAGEQFVTPGLAQSLVTAHAPTVTPATMFVTPGLAQRLAAAYAPNVLMILRPDSTIAADGWDTGPTPAGDLDANTSDDSDSTWIEDTPA